MMVLAVFAFLALASAGMAATTADLKACEADGSFTGDQAVQSTSLLQFGNARARAGQTQERSHRSTFEVESESWGKDLPSLTVLDDGYKGPLEVVMHLPQSLEYYKALFQRNDAQRVIADELGKALGTSSHQLKVIDIVDVEYTKADDTTVGDVGETLFQGGKGHPGRDHGADHGDHSSEDDTGDGHRRDHLHRSHRGHHQEDDTTTTMPEDNSDFEGETPATTPPNTTDDDEGRKGTPQPTGANDSDWEDGNATETIPGNGEDEGVEGKESTSQPPEEPAKGKESTSQPPEEPAKGDASTSEPPEGTPEGDGTTSLPPDETTSPGVSSSMPSEILVQIQRQQVGRKHAVVTLEVVPGQKRSDLIPSVLVKELFYLMKSMDIERGATFNVLFNKAYIESVKRLPGGPQSRAVGRFVGTSLWIVMAIAAVFSTNVFH